MHLPQNLQCNACQYSLNHPVDVCPICNEQFYWLVVPRYTLDEAEIQDYCSRMTQLTEGRITEAFLTHGGHLWLPHNFWECDPNGISLKTLTWVDRVKYFQHATAEGADQPTSREPEPAVWDTQPAQASPFYEDEEERLVVDDLDDTVDTPMTWAEEPAATGSPPPQDPRATVPSPTRFAHDQVDPNDTLPGVSMEPTTSAFTNRPDAISQPRPQPDVPRQPTTAAPRRRAPAQPSKRTAPAADSATVKANASSPRFPIAPLAICLFLVFLSLGYFVLRYHKNQHAPPATLSTKVDQDEPAVLP